MTKEKCEDCGRVKVANAYGWLFCPKCDKNKRSQFNSMVQEKNGGYY